VSRGDAVRALILAFECGVFAVTGHHFATTANAFEVARLGTEVGLLALVMTPIIVAGGIDLSVGSMMGLAAVVLGSLWHDMGLPLPVAVALTLCAGLLGGAVNAVLIARYGFSALIVTLGTMSLFRGVALGMTRGIVSYSGFPAGFLGLGQGYIAGLVPTQVVLLLVMVIVCAAWLHGTIWGRAMTVIGYAPEGARYAGIPVGRRLAFVYLVSGVVASLAGIVYVAHLGEAKADAGMGYELMAITAVVLGGASIFGGRGTVLGTVLGFLMIVVLENGLRLSGAPTELAGVLTGILLIATVVGERMIETVRWGRVVVLTGAAVGGLVVAAAAKQSATHPMRVIAVMPKAKGDPYFISARQGAAAAAKALGVELVWDGPTELDAAKQNEVVEGWITRRVDAIAVSVENRAAISTVLRKARAHGIAVVTWDADAEPDARDFFVNQATPQGIGYTLADEAAKVMHDSGEMAIITASLSAANQNAWIGYIKERLASRYPGIRVVAIEPSDGDRDRAFAATQTVMAVHPHVRVILGIATPAVPGAAEAVAQSGRQDVHVVGLSLPSLCRPYVKSGVVSSIVLWNTTDLGSLAVRTAAAVASGTLHRGDTVLDGGPLGSIQVVGDEVRLGQPFVFTKENIDRFQF
jgi:rhamnose transport system substrate-binding protein